MLFFNAYVNRKLNLKLDYKCIYFKDQLLFVYVIYILSYMYIMFLY